MRRAPLLVLLISLMLLAGCKGSAQQEENFNRWKAGFLSIGELELEAEVSVSDDNSICRYKLLYERNGDGQIVEVLEPRLISKVKAHLKDEKAELSYDGAILETGSAVTERLSPIMALPTFMEFLKEGHFEGAWTENVDGKEMLVTELELADGMRMTLWQENENLAPVLAAIRSDEQVEVKISF